MITHIDITGVGSYAPDDATKAYVADCVQKLRRYVPRHARESLKVEVKISEHGTGTAAKYQVELLFHLPEKTLTAKDTGESAKAAADTAEAKMAGQLRKYKQQHVSHIGKRKLMGVFKRSFAREKM